MSQNQLSIPGALVEENDVVERFIEASKELAPSVQVILAKRILHPGSKRVVCLAARTSVPLNENELASVSDLALRLSDGTNVRLSLSFFNDVNGGEVPLESPTPTFGQQPRFNQSKFNQSVYNRIYDPDRYAVYTVHNESKLGLVLAMTTVAAITGVYMVFSGAFNLQKYAQEMTRKAPPVAAVQAVAKPNTHTASTEKTAAVNVSPIEQGSEFVPAPTNGSRANAGRSVAKASTTPRWRSSHRRRLHAHSTAPETAYAPEPPCNQSYTPRSGALVPPPPPMIPSFPASMAIDQSIMNNPVAFSKAMMRFGINPAAMPAENQAVVPSVRPSTAKKAVTKPAASSHPQIGSFEPMHEAQASKSLPSASNKIQEPADRSSGASASKGLPPVAMEGSAKSGSAGKSSKAGDQGEGSARSDLATGSKQPTTASPPATLSSPVHQNAAKQPEKTATIKPDALAKVTTATSKDAVGDSKSARANNASPVDQPTIVAKETSEKFSLPKKAEPSLDLLQIAPAPARTQWGSK